MTATSYKPESCVRSLCEFVGVEYSNDLLQVDDGPDLAGAAVNLRTRKTGSDAGSHAKSGRVGPTELYICQRVAADELVEYGYSIDKIVPNLLMLSWYSIMLPIKLLLALVVNKKRVGGLKAAISRRMRRLPRQTDAR